MQLFYLAFHYGNVIAVVPFTECTTISEISDAAKNMGMRAVVKLVERKE